MSRSRTSRCPAVEGLGDVTDLVSVVAEADVVVDPSVPGIDALCAALPNTRVAILDLSGIGLTAAGLGRLGGVLASGGPFDAALKSLNLKGNAGITESDVEQLRREAGGIAIEM